MIKYIVFNKYDILVKKVNDIPILIDDKDFQQISKLANVVYQDDSIIIANVLETDKLANHFQFFNIRHYLINFEQSIVDKIIYYQQLTNYYNSHKYCRLCGSNLNKSDVSKFLYCKNCEHDIYPQISPCIIVRIERDNEILMSRGVGFPPNKWGLIAGFVEIGETLEDAVKREVMEEVGIEVTDIKYWGSQPWVFPNSILMVGYTAKYQSGSIKVDYNELEDARFVTVDNIPGLPGSETSIAYKMINQFIQRYRDE
jgi:NAD+ diphosphatase